MAPSVVYFFFVCCDVTDTLVVDHMLMRGFKLTTADNETAFLKGTKAKMRNE